MADTVTSMMTEYLDSLEWEKPPSFMFVVLDAGGWHLEPSGFPDEAWIGEIPPGEMLVVTADMLKIAISAVGLVPTLPAGWQGVAFSTEVWLVEQNVGSGPDPVLEDMARAHILHEHPGRVECKNIWVSLDDGRFGMLTIDREGKTRVSHITPISESGDPNFREGRVPESLESITMSLSKTGVRNG